MKQLDLVAISKNESFIERCRTLCADFDFQYAHFGSSEDFFEQSEHAPTIKCFILDCTKFENIHEAAGTIQVARQMMDRSYIISILNSKVDPNEMELLKKSGANLIMLDNEFTTNSKLEFVASQVIKSAFIPVKVVDLVPESSINGHLYMLMPMNRKFLKVYKPGSKIDNAFIIKYAEAKELYTHRNDLSAWVEYIQKFQARDDNAGARSCRANFLKLQQAFLDLVILISDQTTSTSFAAGKTLYALCEKFCADLLVSLREVMAPWEAVNNSSIGDFGSVERGTAVAAYAGMLAEKISPAVAPKAMMGGLLADIGLILVSPEVSRKIRTGNVAHMTGEERMEYMKHPIYGLNQILSKRIPLDDLIKDMILMSHERMDQKGFPNKPAAVKMKEEPMIIRLAQELDDALTIKLGKERVEFDGTFKTFLSKKINEGDGYPLMMLLKLNPLIRRAG
ncbi:HD-GYP domain-containing protein [Bdellovibrio sp. NC01]|uniref:HD-GYP domain-containing protein n=1 Tax=Bdellovibrio sp. NC01 TaxID=2220073 RepID=UPI00115BB674|nr:HD domain-containing phosphohydrolase [Bdellovibrio sp. NC01]QDK38047.1 hypothetical protein DOE51_10835 [Bdellovibrio sp. NC01]